jgi:hypothetical protein
MVTLGRDKYLSFMLEPSESFRVNNPVTVTLKDCTYGVRLFVSHSATGVLTPDRMRRETFLSLLYVLTYS